MFDRSAIRLIQPAVGRLAQAVHRLGLSANQLTLLGFGLGVLAAYQIATGAFLTGLVTILFSRLCDALDGALARLTQPTDAGGFLDTALDFLFYGSIPLAFALHDPARNALPAAVLLFAFIGTGSSFLAFATFAAKRGLHNLNYPDKSFYFLGGLTEAGETLACFCAMCLWPGYFVELAYGFAALCLTTIITRLWWGWRTFA